MNCVSVNIGLINMYVTQNKTRTMINFNVNAKNRLAGVLAKNVELNTTQTTLIYSFVKK